MRGYGWLDHLLNLSAIGLIAPTWELSNLDYCDIDLATQIVGANRDLILGMKAHRPQHDAWRGDPPVGACTLADAVGLPLMVHIGSGPPPIDAIIPLLRSGDILTHCCTGGTHRIVDAAGLVRADVRRLHEHGLILDLGHGAASFSYASAEALLRQGILPDVISSDIHQLSVQGPMFDLPTTLSKFLNLGLSLPEVIERATARPAAAMRRSELGTLRPGSPADLALFRLEEGRYTFYDVEMAARPGTTRLVNTLTLVAGQPLPRVSEQPRAPWAALPPHQAAQR